MLLFGSLFEGIVSRHPISLFPELAIVLHFLGVLLDARSTKGVGAINLCGYLGFHTDWALVHSGVVDGSARGSGALGL